MIGLEYICRVFEMDYKTLASRLGITPQTINSWLRRKRRIPQERLKQLSEFFSITERYFQQELGGAEKDEIDLIYFKKVGEKRRFEIPDSIIIDGEEYQGTVSFNPEESIISMLEARSARRQLIPRLLEDIANILHKDTDESENYKRLRQIANMLGRKGVEHEQDTMSIRLLDMWLYLISPFGNPEYLEEKQFNGDPIFEKLRKLLSETDRYK
jgi:transcriptional regulator with XRE-family HTH domain